VVFESPSDAVAPVRDYSDPRRRDRPFDNALERSGHEVNLADQSRQHNRGCFTFSTQGPQRSTARHVAL